MKNGKIKCSAPIGVLKEQYGQGFTITLKLKQPTSNASGNDNTDSAPALPKVKSELETLFGRTLELQDEHSVSYT